MTKAQLKLLSESQNCTIYSIQFAEDNATEFDKFLQKFKDSSEFKEDFYLIISVLTTFMEKGSLERFFRPEGKMTDSVAALPVYKSKLRLYCLRLSDHIVVLGNGGVKRTKRYEDDEELTGYVLTLQRFEQLLKAYLAENKITIEQLPASNITEQDFEM